MKGIVGKCNLCGEHTHLIKSKYLELDGKYCLKCYGRMYRNRGTVKDRGRKYQQTVCADRPKVFETDPIVDKCKRCGKVKTLVQSKYPDFNDKYCHHCYTKVYQRYMRKRYTAEKKKRKKKNNALARLTKESTVSADRLRLPARRTGKCEECGEMKVLVRSMYRQVDNKYCLQCYNKAYQKFAARRKRAKDKAPTIRKVKRARHRASSPLQLQGLTGGRYEQSLQRLLNQMYE